MTAPRPFVVAGNGRSVSRITPGTILADDFIIRTNNFFFEPKYFLGRRVDLAFMGGDPRVAPFMFETLYRCRADYDLRSWSSQNPRVQRAGQRRFGALFQPMRYRDDAIRAQLDQLIGKYGKVPTTGVYAALMAHGLGAERIILVGMDLYGAEKRYPFDPGHHHRALMGQDLAERGIDHRLHAPELDREILCRLNDRADVEVQVASEETALGDFLPQAPVRGTSGLESPRENPPTDWSTWSGLYPIAALKILRRGSAMVRHLKKRIGGGHE